jgi:putative hydrolase of HD superfamily
MLQNCMTDGVAWQQNGVTSDRVIARGQHIAGGAAAVWEHAAQLIDKAVQAGHLPTGNVAQPK